MKTKWLVFVVLFANCMLPVVQAQVLTLKGGIGSWINLEDSYMKTTKARKINNI